MYYKYLIFLFLLLFSCNKESTGSYQTDHEDFNNIDSQIQALKIEPDSLTTITIFNNIHQKILGLENDSLKNISFFLLSYKALELNDSINFFKLNNEGILLSRKLNDTSKIAESYWDLAHYYSQNNEFEEAFLNYAKAQKLYESIEKTFESARMQMSMAIIQKNQKDYTGSEINTIKALRIFEQFKKNKHIYSGYNNLGIVYNELQEYDKALVYHKKAQKYLKELSGDSYEQTTLNNIGVVYQNMGKFNEAINYFEKALDDQDLINQNPRLYAMLLDNLAYSKFHFGERGEVLKTLQKGRKIRDSIDHKSGLIVSDLRLAEVLVSFGDSVSALKYAENAYFLSKETDNNRDFLRSLILLSILDPTGEKNALKIYINTSDSLQKEERIIREKFTRIQYETDEFIAENEQLNVQKKWMIAGFSGVVLLLISISAIILLKRKNKELKLIQLQQKANEDIYTLMIESQSNIERGQEQEKKRISKELHDGILSQFFGVRLNLELLNEKTDKDSAVKREKYIKELKALETEIRKVSHQLNSDLVSSDVSFINILNDLLRGQEDLGGYSGKIDFEGKIEWEKISPKIKINLFRIIQEALHNINKYAGANNVRIVFMYLSEKLKLIIEDDGKGFDVENSHDGIGITNMKSRIQDLAGEISILSNQKGTKISIKIPLKNEVREGKSTFSR